MGGKYTPVPANNGLQETVGNQQSAIQRLTQERYQPYDTPDTYEAKIRPLLLGVANNDVQVLGFLKSYLTGDFYTRMRIANPGGINAFFTELKNMWLEREQNLSGRISEELNQFANQALPIATVGNFQSPPIMYPIKSEKAQHAFYIVDQEGNNIDPNQETDYYKYIAQAYNSLKRPQRNNNSARFDRIEEGLDETRDAVNETWDSINQLSNQFQKLNIHKPVAQSNFNRGYFKPITPINFQHTPPASDNEKDGYDKVENACASEFGRANDATINALGWKADKPSDFTIKGNSKHITDSLGWFTDVPISIKNKDGKTVTATGNFTRIDNGEPEPMLCLAYINPTFSKAPKVEDPPKEKQDQASTNSSSPTSEEDLKKKSA
ncbi:hypothetical protein GLOIN_2v1481897 [Rhizophagus clarus]|uniref:Uncharacterized protein n=1 Tax=Rhizophagus clarus TaxID=94130 RepID=A0A8H3L1N6_9GLOM|nr:hypothetical protein GLOIN_2v1481897 [Rhizophagus clarus]